jgi:hypothetical protein
MVAGTIVAEILLHHSEGKPHPDTHFRTAPIFSPQVAAVTSNAMIFISSTY